MPLSAKAVLKSCSIVVPVLRLKNFAISALIVFEELNLSDCLLAAASVSKAFCFKSVQYDHYMSDDLPT